jgi:hypothetical protein|tara:strand:- start:218 stop:1918 length:1701 start_codon:yes stop_codon:yes gene_type:complete
MPRKATKNMPSGGRIGIPFDNDDQLHAICHHLSTHNTSLNRTATYVRDGYDGTYVRLNRGAGLYGFEIKQRNEENPYTNPKRFPVLKYILICSTDAGGVDTCRYLDWKLSFDHHLNVYRGGERAIRTFTYTHTGTEDHFLACNKNLSVSVSSLNTDYLATLERVVSKVYRYTRLQVENTEAWNRATVRLGPKGLKSVDNHEVRYTNEFVKEAGAGYYVGLMGVEKDADVLKPVPFSTKLDARKYSDELHAPFDRQRARRWARQEAEKRNGKFGLGQWHRHGQQKQEAAAAHAAKQKELFPKDVEEALNRIQQARAATKNPSLEAWQAEQAATAQGAAKPDRDRARVVTEKQQGEKEHELRLREAQAKATADLAVTALQDAAKAKQKADECASKAATYAEAAKQAKQDLATKQQAAESKQPEAVVALQAARMAANGAKLKAKRAAVTSQTTATLATEAKDRAEWTSEQSTATKRKVDELKAMPPPEAAAAIKKQRQRQYHECEEREEVEAAAAAAAAHLDLEAQRPQIKPRAATAVLSCEQRERQYHAAAAAATSGHALLGHGSVVE